MGKSIEVIRETTYQRNCPRCGDLLTYVNKYGLTAAIKRNTNCNKCKSRSGIFDLNERKVPNTTNIKSKYFGKSCSWKGCLEKNLAGRGFCANHYHLKFFSKKAKATKCEHIKRRAHRQGFCHPCYKKFGKFLKASCHTDRERVAKGLCIECYRALPSVKLRAIKVRRLKKYGMSNPEFKEMLSRQKNKCAICGIPNPIHIDHDHLTGKVRGIVCFHCNTGLGHFKDNGALLLNAINYLKRAK